jgi:mono/diheme cytochrome c family protein
MARQPSYRPLQPSSFFKDGRASRPPVAGTVAQGQFGEDAHLHNGRGGNGMAAAQPASLFGLGMTNPVAVAALASNRERAFAVLDYVDTFPFEVDEAVLKRGRERYMIYCAVCHDPSGGGNGKIVQRGFTRPPNYATDRSRGFERRGIDVPLRDVPPGYLFEVITHGFGAMADYSSQVSPRDRWAIVAYIRALQLSQYAPLRDLPESARKDVLRELEAKP